ncbi:MAG: trigger factor [Actinobacteria bacterium]|nr:trigger factor [Actinomycetota bacterium]
MKTDVENLSPTRVRLTVQVPFEELKPNLDKAYREVARQVRVPGFRPGKVPPQVIDLRIGRAAVLEQAVNDAVPELYSKAVAEHEVVPISQPEVAVTRLDDGNELAFTAEVDVRPSFDLPELSSLSVTVENAEVDPDQVEGYLGTLRDRFASLRTVDRPAQAGDFVSIDLAATVDGATVEDAQTTGYSYEVGSESMLDGLDEALIGMSAAESKTFSAELAGGSAAGKMAEVQVTVNSVKVKDLPELDDEFAQSASEFDTIGELRAATRGQLEAVRRAGQATQARQRLLDALVEEIDMPLPERIVEAEVEQRRHSMADQLARAGLAMDEYLESAGTTQAKLEEDFLADSRRSVKAQFILDQVARSEDLKVSTDELSAYVTEQAYRMGVAPDQLAKQLSDNGQLAAVATDVLRGNALSWLAAHATVVDEAGRPVELSAEPAADDDGQPGDDGEPGDDGAPNADGADAS